jgi:hypothetical protein
MQAEIFRSACEHHYQRMYQGIFHSIVKIAREVKSFEMEWLNFPIGGSKVAFFRPDCFNPGHKSRADILPTL